MIGAGTILGGASLAMGVGSAIFGSRKARKAARERERLLRQQKAASDAWYNRNYYQDYINSVAGQNAIRQVRDAWSNATQEARARQAITGGTPEQAQAVAQAGGEAMARTVGNLAAQGEANKRQIDAQKAAMDANIVAQQGAIEDARQAAGANLMENGVGLAMQGLTSVLEATPSKESVSGKPGIQYMEGIPYEKIPEMQFPKKIKPLF